jgi:hypothetical protein
VFFVALLHLFKRPETANFRWCILSMWIFAVFGMAVFGMPDSTELQSNDLHVLFVPLMTFYGFALVLVMWSRLEINYRLARLASWDYLRHFSPHLSQFLILTLGRLGRVQWPPMFRLHCHPRPDPGREIITSTCPGGRARRIARASGCQLGRTG